MSSQFFFPRSRSFSASRTSMYPPCSFSPWTTSSRLPLLQALARIADRLPRAAIPHDDRPAAILAGRDRALEVAIVDRVILGLHGEPLVLRREARAPSAPPTRAARRRARGGSRSAAPSPRASGSRTSAPSRVACTCPDGSSVRREVAHRIVALEAPRRCAPTRASLASLHAVVLRPGSLFGPTRRRGNSTRPPCPSRAARFMASNGARTFTSLSK